MMMAALVLCGSISASSAQEKTTVAGVPMVKLNNGVWMPRFGLGTFLQPSNDVCRQSCLTALRAGYRHIDTAHAYYDEEGVARQSGKAAYPVRKSG